jgi:hypothetical protein
MGAIAGCWQGMAAVFLGSGRVFQVKPGRHEWQHEGDYRE